MLMSKNGFSLWTFTIHCWRCAYPPSWQCKGPNTVCQNIVCNAKVFLHSSCHFRMGSDISHHLRFCVQWPFPKTWCCPDNSVMHGVPLEMHWRYHKLHFIAFDCILHLQQSVHSILMQVNWLISCVPSIVPDTNYRISKYWYQMMGYTCT